MSHATPAPIHWLDRVESTQDIAHRLAGDGAPAGTVVVAVEQTAGRGSRGRSWASPRGGLWLSMIWRPLVAAAPEALSLRAALAVTAALAEAGVDGVCIKWPNDLMLGDRKLGGILCEARWNGDQLGWISAGIGLNVQNPVPPELAGVAVSLAGGGSELRAGDLVTPLVAALRAAGEAVGPLTALELRRFAELDWLDGRAVTEPVPGIADGVAPDGSLRVIRQDGSVELVRAGPVISADVLSSQP